MCTVQFTETTFRILVTSNLNVAWHDVNYLNTYKRSDDKGTYFA